MNIATLIDTIAEALAADTALQGWAALTYEQDATIYVDIDERNPPGPDQMPCVILYPDNKSAGYGRSEKQHRVIVEVWLHDDESRIRLAEHIIEYLGVGRIETMRKHVENVVAGIDLGDDGLLEEVLTEYETVAQFPLFVAVMAMTITEPVTLGSNYLE